MARFHPLPARAATMRSAARPKPTRPRTDRLVRPVDYPRIDAAENGQSGPSGASRNGPVPRKRALLTGIRTKRKQIVPQLPPNGTRLPPGLASRVNAPRRQKHPMPQYRRQLHPPSSIRLFWPYAAAPATAKVHRANPTAWTRSSATRKMPVTLDPSQGHDVQARSSFRPDTPPGSTISLFIAVH